MQDTKYYYQVELLLKVLPDVMSEGGFALKGGTAINMFLRNMPRLSVDIDLCYTKIEDRETTLREIDSSLKRVASKIAGTHKGTSVKHERIGGGYVCRLNIYNQRALIKVETNYVLRGTVNSTVGVDLCERAQDEFGVFRNVNCLSVEDLFGGKICAALDRQHPRDLFDIKLLLENEGLTDEIRRAFIVYLSSHNRPISDLLNPNRLDVGRVYEEEFEGMTTIPVSYKELVEVREGLIEAIQNTLTDSERRFLLSLKEGNPDWSLVPIDGIEKFPAIQWKLKNINKIEPKKHRVMINRLKEKLQL